MQRRFDLAIVVIAVMVLIFAGVAGHRGKTAGQPDSFLLATAAPQFLGISFLTARAKKLPMKRRLKWSLTR